MSEVVALGSRRAETTLRIGLLRLTDSAPAIVAHEFGWFAEEGIEAELHVEPSWANIADKLAYGLLDAAIILPPLAFAVELGLRGISQPLIVPCNVSLGGNTVTLSRRSWRREVRAMAGKRGSSSVQALAAFSCRARRTPCRWVSFMPIPRIICYCATGWPPRDFRPAAMCA